MSQLTGQIRHVALEHGRSAPRQFRTQFFDYVGMIVPRIVNAVTGKEVKDDAAIRRVKFAAFAVRVFGFHLEQFEKPNPLRIDKIAVLLRWRANGGSCQGLSPDNPSGREWFVRGFT